MTNKMKSGRGQAGSSRSVPVLSEFCILILESCGAFLQLRHIYEYLNFPEATRSEGGSPHRVLDCWF